jgi:Plasmid pRiA4b ORF-3-like protein
MPEKRSAVPSEILQIKVTLLGTSPPIWRRLLVPADLTLAKLHQILQVAVGWHDSHLHGFSVGPRHFRIPDPDDELDGLPPAEGERTARLSRVLDVVGSKAIYIYDFGDSWEHSVVLEKRRPADPNLTYPICTDGQLACPPEDCGGVPGFYNLVEALADPTHEEHKEMLRWLGKKFDPQAFSVDRVNQVLVLTRRRK